MELKISEIAALTGITVRTLHYYDEIGLLKPSEITESGYRLYYNDSLEILQQILFFRENIDKNGEGTAKFISKAIEIYCSR
ncbi:MAG: MerR family transcriptional regulator [Romboutsia sp.]